MDKNNPEYISRMVLMAPKKQIEETKDLQAEIWAGDKPVYNSKIEDVFQKLESGELGLTSEEAKVKLEKFGRNALDEGKKMTLIQRFFEQLKDMMIIVLLVAALVSGIMAVINGHYADLIDSGLILLIVIMNAVIGLVQESNAEKALDALKDMNKPDAKVIRDGIQMSIKSEEIAIGDVVVLEAGDIVPADMRLIESVSLKIEEAALTGESVPSEKHVGELENENPPLGDRTNLCYSSGIVSYGRGKGVVFATGMSTEVGKIAKMLSSGGDDKTPLQQQLAKTAKILSFGVIAIAAVIFIFNLIFRDKAAPIMDSIIASFMIAVAIAVAAIPEGLPAVVTIVLSIGVKRMSARKAIVSNLPSVETLGCCEIICSDKTGTLTLNQMTVKELYTPENGNYSSAEVMMTDGSDLLVRGMVLCNDTKESEGVLIGDPTETALVAYAKEIGFEGNSEKYKRVDEKPFDSIRKLMSTVNLVEGKKVGHIKGAPDILINKCSKIYDGSEIRNINKSDKDKILSANSEMASKALRVLAVAVKYEELELESIEEDMIFVGLVGMIDPPRPEVKDAVAVCKRAGMTAIMITGDHMDTAKAIASEIGILEEGKRAITGADLDKMSDEEFLQEIENIRVYARVSPENKVRIVKGFKSINKVVAMTGDGVNDAPSIHEADIGIGMGITGTDVSKGAADMVLADDNFATIVAAVEEGRKIYSNIKKAVQYLMSANIAEVVCLFITTVILSAIAGRNITILTPVMILWINLVTDSLPALALGTEAAESDVMLYPPRKAGSSLFAGKTGLDIIIQGVMQSILVMVSFVLGEYVAGVGNGNHGVAMTMAFITLCMIQLFHAYNLRSQNHSLFARNPFKNKFLNLAFLVGSVLTIVPLVIPPVAKAIFDAVPLNGTQWGVALGLSVLIIPFVELQKLVEEIIERKTGKTFN